MADEAPKAALKAKTTTRVKPAAAPAVEISKPVIIREDY